MRVRRGAARRRRRRCWCSYGAWRLLGTRPGATSVDARGLAGRRGGAARRGARPAGACCVGARWCCRGCRRGGRAPAVAGLVVLGSVTLLAIPVLGRFGARADNPTLLDRHYGVGCGWCFARAGRRRRGGRGVAAAASPTAAEGVPMARVLVVDDDHTVREVVVSYLRAGRARRRRGRRRRDRRWRRCATSPADLVVLDLMLPGIDGLEVCRRLRETQRRAGDHADRARRRDRPGRRARAAAPTTTSPSRSARASWCCGSTRCCAGPGSGPRPTTGRLRRRRPRRRPGRHVATLGRRARWR